MSACRYVGSADTYVCMYMFYTYADSRCYQHLYKQTADVHVHASVDVHVQADVYAYTHVYTCEYESRCICICTHLDVHIQADVSAYTLITHLDVQDI
jgi:hypothetical protein